MKKSYKIEVDCPSCANKMEIEANNTDGVKDCTINFLMLKMKVTFEDGVDEKEVMENVLKNCRKIEKDCEIYF
ncbi:heavy-metal-associated domain-containing protein [Anaerococcus obesiensis]|uniref:heavy-metal-associated domain-containing protein n=1 Tax=Anaerococcus obesiensis TaxID=1287640 RepID=UPI0039944043